MCLRSWWRCFVFGGYQGGECGKMMFLRELLEMVRVVKEDGKVTVAYMKSFEIEQMWINKGIEQGISQGIEQGRSEERANTLREKARADRLERELRKLRRGRRDV